MDHPKDHALFGRLDFQRICRKSSKLKSPLSPHSLGSKKMAGRFHPPHTKKRMQKKTPKKNQGCFLDKCFFGSPKKILQNYKKKHLPKISQKHLGIFCDKKNSPMLCALWNSSWRGGGELTGTFREVWGCDFPWRIHGAKGIFTLEVVPVDH